MKMLQLEGIYLYLKTKIKQMRKLLLLLFVFYSCKNKTEKHIEEQKKTIENGKSKI